MVLVEREALAERAWAEDLVSAAGEEERGRLEAAIGERRRDRGIQSEERKGKRT